MATGYEREFYNAVSRIAKAIERQVDLAELQYLETATSHGMVENLAEVGKRYRNLQKRLWPEIYK
jgi:hypothetical protein